MGLPSLVSAGDFPGQYQPIPYVHSTQLPVVGAKIQVLDDINISNNLIISVLNKGCDAILVDLRTCRDTEDLAKHLLQDVDLSIIKSFFWLPKKQWTSFTSEVNDLSFSQAGSGENIFFVNGIASANQAFHVSPNLDTVNQICEILHFVLRTITKSGEKSPIQLPIILPLGHHYSENLIKIRAVKILCHLLQSPLEEEKCLLQLYAYGEPAQKDNANLISIASQGLSAACGNAAGIFLGPWMRNAADLDLTLLSVQSGLILQYETDLFGSPDPAAGSYFFEKCTDQLAEAAWTQFKTSL